MLCQSTGLNTPASHTPRRPAGGLLRNNGTPKIFLSWADSWLENKIWWLFFLDTHTHTRIYCAICDSHLDGMNQHLLESWPNKFSCLSVGSTVNHLTLRPIYGCQWGGGKKVRQQCFHHCVIVCWGQRCLVLYWTKQLSHWPIGGILGHRWRAHFVITPARDGLALFFY